MAKGGHRRKQDRARAQALRAEDARRRAATKARQHFDEAFERAIDPALPPAGLAALILDELPDSIAVGRIAHTRAERTAELATLVELVQKDAAFAPLAETARLMLAARPAGPPPGVLAFAAVAAHVTGDEAAARRHADALLEIARAASDKDVLEVAREVLTWTHPDEAVQIAERYAAEHHSNRNRASFIRMMAEIESKGQAAQREGEAALAAEKDGGRAVIEMFDALRQRVLSAPSLSPKDLARDQARLTKGLHEPLRTLVERGVAGVYLERAFEDLGACVAGAPATGSPATSSQ